MSTERKSCADCIFIVPYIKEIIEESGLSQKDFAKRLDTTPKNLSILVRGSKAYQSI